MASSTPGCCPPVRVGRSAPTTSTTSSTAVTIAALSVHAYSPRLDQMTHYDLVDGRLVIAGVEQRGESW